MSSLPEEIYHEILLRLPAESLLVFKCVCKNWYALITSSTFIKLHLQFTIHKNNPNLMFRLNDTKLYSLDSDSLASSIRETVDDRIEVDFPFKSFGYKVQLWASCDGLVCIQLFNIFDGKKFLCLWNPATKEYKEIPRSPYEFDGLNNDCMCACALGYDQKIDDYKLLIGLEDHDSDDSTVVQVYTLASNSWKTGQIVPYMFIDYSGVLVNGDFNWLVIHQNNYSLFSLNISDESFKEMQLPKELLEKSEDPCMILGVLEGSLCVLVNSYVNLVKINVEVWEMLAYGVQNSWTRRYIITHESIIRDHGKLSMMWCLTNGKILLFGYSSLVLFDPEQGSGIKLNIYRIRFTGSLNYFESLVSLKSGTFVGGKGRPEELQKIRRNKRSRRS